MPKKKRSKDYNKFKSKIAPVKSIKRPLRIGVYGKPGVGKTTFCASGPKVLLVDMDEEGTLSVKDRNIDVTYVKTFEEIDLLYWFLKKGDHSYGTVALDTVTSLQRIGLSFVLKEAAELDLTKDPQMPDRRDYGKLTVALTDVLLNFRNLPMNLILTAHERSSSEEEGELDIYPDLTPRIRSVYEGCVDIIGRLYTREIENDEGKRKVVRRMLVGPHERYISKSRSSALGAILKNPTFPAIAKTIAKG